MPSLKFTSINALQSKCTNRQSWWLAFRKVFGFSTQNKNVKKKKKNKLLPSSCAGSLYNEALSVTVSFFLFFFTMKCLLLRYLSKRSLGALIFYRFLFTDLTAMSKMWFTLYSFYLLAFFFFASNWTSNVCYILYTFLFWCQ